MSSNGKSGKGKTPSAKDRRERAAAARAAQEAAERRRDRTIKVVGGIAVLAIVAIIVGGAVWQSRSSSTASDIPAPDPNAPVPTGVVSTGENAWAVPVPGTAPETAPLLQVWEDPQCPACAAMEAANGAGIVELATSGKARVFWRPTAFLDASLAKPNAANNAANSSHRAIAAWGCAIDAGKSVEFHQLMFANQPEPEGTGWTEAALIDLGQQAGVSGDALTTYTSCVQSNTYLAWAANSLQAFGEGGIQQTPTGILDGTALDNSVLADKAKLDAAVAEAAKK